MTLVSFWETHPDSSEEMLHAPGVWWMKVAGVPPHTTQIPCMPPGALTLLNVCLAPPPPHALPPRPRQRPPVIGPALPPPLCRRAGPPIPI